MERGLIVFAVIAVAIIGVLLAFGTLPSRVVAQDTGRFVPWLISWGLAWVAVAAAVVVAGFLLGTGRRAR